MSKIECPKSKIECPTLYHEAYKTHIQRYEFDYIENYFKLLKGKLVKMIICFDANALYLLC